MIYNNKLRSKLPEDFTKEEAIAYYKFWTEKSKSLVRDIEEKVNEMKFGNTRMDILHEKFGMMNIVEGAHSDQKISLSEPLSTDNDGRQRRKQT